jgi:hypothetical protein
MDSLQDIVGQVARQMHIIPYTLICGPIFLIDINGLTFYHLLLPDYHQLAVRTQSEANILMM